MNQPPRVYWKKKRSQNKPAADPGGFGLNLIKGNSPIIMDTGNSRHEEEKLISVFSPVTSNQ